MTPILIISILLITKVSNLVLNSTILFSSIISHILGILSFILSIISVIFSAYLSKKNIKEQKEQKQIEIEEKEII